MNIFATGEAIISILDRGDIYLDGENLIYKNVRFSWSMRSMVPAFDQKLQAQ